MLPTYVFANVVQFLHFYELDALLLADHHCSQLAVAAASRIRVFDFSEFEFVIYHTSVKICKMAAYRLTYSETWLEFQDGTDLIDFVPTAMRNCVIGRLLLWNKACCNAMREVTRTMVVKGTLCLNSLAFANVHELVKFAVSFRSVKVCGSSHMHLIAYRSRPNSAHTGTVRKLCELTKRFLNPRPHVNICDKRLDPSSSPPLYGYKQRILPFLSYMIHVAVLFTRTDCWTPFT